MSRIHSLYSITLLLPSADLTFGQTADPIPPDAKSALGEPGKETFRARC